MIKQFFTKLAQIPNDLLLHFFYGTILSFPLVALFNLWGIAFVLLIAYGKEIIDFIIKDSSGNEYNFKRSIPDVIFTIAPAVLFYLIKLL
jgi:hypothetical protein